MKSRIANRFLLTAVMALVLGVLLAVSSFAALSLTIENTLSGLEGGVNYTAAKYDFANNAYGEFTAVDANTKLTSGIWGVKAGDAEPEVLFAQTSESGTFNFWDTEADSIDGSAFKGDVLTDSYVPGYWSAPTGGAFVKVTNYPDFTSICIHLAKSAFLAKADGATTWEGATPISGENNLVAEATYWYGFTNEQVIPVSSFNGYTTEAINITVGSVAYNSGYSVNTLTPKVVFYTKNIGSDAVSEYVGVCSYNSTTEKLTAALPENVPADAYIVAVGFKPYYGTPDDIFVNNADNNEDRGYYHHRMVKGTNGFDLTAPNIPAPTGITGGEGVLVGLQDGKYYQAAPMLLNAAGTALEAGEFKAVTATTPLAGLYVVRETNATQTIFSDVTDMLYVEGDSVARANLFNLRDDGKYLKVKSSTDVFVPGTFTRNGALQVGHWNKWALGNTQGADAGVDNLTALYNAFAAYDALGDDKTGAEATLLAAKTTVANEMNKLVTRYAFDADEIIKTSDAISFKFSVYQNNVFLSFTTLRTKVEVYVADAEGNISVYSKTFEDAFTSVNGTYTRTLEFSELLPAEGYIVGMTIRPATDIKPEEITGTGKGQQRFITVVDPANYKIKAKASAPKFTVSANAEAGFDLTITNYNSLATYEYRKEGDTAWTTVPSGANVITVATAGKYEFRTFGALLIGTATTTFEVEKLAPVAPTVTATEIASPEAFKAVITNSAKTYTYEYKAEGATDWTAIEGNSFEVAPGKYTVRAFGDIYEGEATFDFETTLATPVAPIVSVTPGASDFTIKIKNYSDKYVYEYKAEAATDWTAVTGGSFVVTEAGKYTVRAGGAVYNGYATVSFKTVDVPMSVRNIVVDGDKLTNLDAAVAYEYAAVTRDGIGDTWTAIPAGTEFTLPAYGLYAVRVAATGSESASVAMVFLNQGPIDQRGNILHTTEIVGDGGSNKDKTLNVPVIKDLGEPTLTNVLTSQYTDGTWTGFNINSNLQKTNSFNELRIGGTSCYAGNYFKAYVESTDPVAKATALENSRTIVGNIHFTYGYEADEIIPMASWDSYKFTVAKRQGSIAVTKGSVKTKVTLLIATEYGEIVERSALYDAGNFATKDITTKQSDFDDNTGYILGIKIYPYYIPEETVVTPNGSTYADLNLQLHRNTYKIILPKTPAPDYLTFDKATGSVEGLDPNLEYYYAPYTVTGVGETQYVSSVDHLEIEAGLWGIGLVSKDPEYADSDPFLVFVRGDEAERKFLGTIESKGTYEGYKVQGTEDWVPGVWTGKSNATYSSFGTYSMSSLGGNNIISALATALKNAEASGDAVALAAARDNIINAVNNDTHLKYAYANDDVIPANELLNFSVTVANRQGGVALGSVTAQVIFSVVAPDGSINEYVWSKVTGMNDTLDVDVQSIENWPSEGWVVGLEVKPWTNPTPESITMAGSVENQMPKYTINVNGYKIKLDPGLPSLETFDAPANGLGEIANLNASMTYEFMIWDEAEGKYVGEGENGEDWIKVPVGSTSFRTPKGQYLFRVAESREFTASGEVVVVVYENGEFTSIENEVKKIHLPNDFVEVAADYEIDVTSKIWVARLALDNIKAVAPESNVIITGDGYKFVIIADNLETDKLVHYYNFDVAFNGESRHDTSYENLKETAGELYITEFFFETADAYPFEDAQLYIEFGEAYEGQTVELSSFNERSGRIRKVEESVVENGWAVFTKFTDTYVVLSAED